MKRFQLSLGVLAFLIVASFTQTSQAGPFVRFGIGIGVGPGYYYGPGPYYYGYPYPYYYPPPTVVYQTAPSVIVRTPPPAIEPLPPPPVPEPPPPPPAPRVIPTQAVAQPGVNPLLAKLNDAGDTVRRDAAVELGRMKAQNAVDALMSVLARDPSPIVRDGAARALGLIAAPRSLRALIYAAQADNDREVRHTAQFAVEVIRTNLRGNQN